MAEWEIQEKQVWKFSAALKWLELFFDRWNNFMWKFKAQSDILKSFFF